jgi:hypothetical protein
MIEQELHEMEEAEHFKEEEERLQQEDDETLQMPSQTTSQSSEELPELGGGHCDARDMQAEAEWVTQEPKRPPSAYFLYVWEEEAKMQAASGKGLALEIQKGWQTLDTQLRSQFTFRAEQLQAQYQAQRRDYLEYGRYRVYATTIMPTPPQVHAVMPA